MCQHSSHLICKWCGLFFLGNRASRNCCQGVEEQTRNKAHKLMPTSYTQSVFMKYFVYNVWSYLYGLDEGEDLKVNQSLWCHVGFGACV